MVFSRKNIVGTIVFPQTNIVGTNVFLDAYRWVGYKDFCERIDSERVYVKTVVSAGT